MDCRIIGLFYLNMLNSVSASYRRQSDAWQHLLLSFSLEKNHTTQTKLGASRYAAVAGTPSRIVVKFEGFVFAEEHYHVNY